MFYMLKLHGDRRKYHPQWLSPDNKKFLFGHQTYDNVFRSCLSGCTVWTAYEVLYVWGAANGWFPYLDPARHPVWFVAIFLLIPLWRETHFFLVHRLLHWRPLMHAFHRIHHLNPNPGPWSGMAMHPVEHLLYLQRGGHPLPGSRILCTSSSTPSSRRSPPLRARGLRGPGVQWAS